jgi:hypothetical protein
VAQSTILSSGTVNGADTLTIEVIRPDSMPAVVRIVWPTAATITTPASYREVASAACVCSLRPPRIWPESERVDGSNGDSDNPFRPLQPSPSTLASSRAAIAPSSSRSVTSKLTPVVRAMLAVR